MEKAFISLEEVDFQTIRKLMEKKGLGRRGFSAALRMIIREWTEMQNKNQPSQEYHTSNQDK